jgi:hypothetical protein
MKKMKKLKKLKRLKRSKKNHRRGSNQIIIQGQNNKSPSKARNSLSKDNLRQLLEGNERV